MSEEKEEAGTGTEAKVAGLDPATIALPLNSGNCDPSVAEDLRAYLRNHSALIIDQCHHLHAQFFPSTALAVKHYIAER